MHSEFRKIYLRNLSENLNLPLLYNVDSNTVIDVYNCRNAALKIRLGLLYLMNK